MNHWESRWQDDRIGFHLKTVNSYLIRYFDQFLKQEHQNVFVPLCGKSLDLCWLAKRTKKVVGVELVEKAVKDFFEENNFNYNVHQVGKFKLFKNDLIEIYQGKVSCGLFGISDDFIENYQSLDERFVKNKESTFFII